MTTAYDQSRIRQHDNCTVEIQRRGPHYGLYCQCHSQWLKWINPQELAVAQAAGVTVRQV